MMNSHLKSRQNKSIFVGDSKSPKEIKQLAVSIAILEIIENDGLLGVTHSKVSRKSKISRAWIYEYIGKEKSALIEFATDVFAGYITRITLAELPQTREALEAQLKEGVEFLFNSVEQNPLIIKLFFRFRGTTNSVGKVIQKYEKKWLENAAKTIVSIIGLPSHQASLVAELILTLRLGFAHRVATSSNSPQARERAESIFKMIHMLLSGNSVF